MRILSLIASATETICALGFGDKLVGISHECDFPPEILNLPRCTTAKFKDDGTSYQIDQRVREIVAEGLSVYRVNIELLRQLKPDLIVTQDHCQVCAVSLGDVESALADVVGYKPVVVSLHPDSLADIWSGIRQVASALGDTQRGDELVRSLKQRMASISAAIPQRDTPPRIACVEWMDPLMACGNWIPELVQLAHAVDRLGAPGKHSAVISWEEFAVSDPEMIVIAPCGFSIERTQSDLNSLVGRPGWADLRAVKTARVFLADGNQYFNRPGPRIVETLQILAEVIYPELPPLLKGAGWIPA